MLLRRVFALVPLLLALGGPAVALDDEEELDFFRKLYADSLYDVAAGQMETFLTRRPEHPQRAELALLLGRSYLALGQGEPALRWFVDFTDSRPEDPRICESLYEAVKFGVGQGLLAQAEPVLDRYLRDYGDCAKRDAAILLSARVKAARGESAVALQLLSFLIDSSGEEELVGRALFERATLKGERDKAAGRSDLETLKATLPRHPLAGFAAGQLAEAAVLEGREEDALAELDWLLRNFAEADLAAPALERKAEILAKAERFEAAAAVLAQRRRSYPGRPDELPLLVREVELLTAAGQGSEAVKRAQEAASRVGETGRAYILLAGAYEADGRMPEAVAAWQKAADLGGGDALPALERLFHLLLSGEDAARLAETSNRLLALLTDPKRRADLLLEQGAYHAERGRAALAQRIWESVETEAPGSDRLPEALYRLALLQEERGLWEQAEAFYRRLILEHGASSRGLQARDGLEALELYYRRDEGAAVESLLALLDEERRAGAVRGRELKIGRLIRDDLKDFPRAADYFRELAAEQSAKEQRALALLEGGRAEKRESERLRHSDRKDEAGPWSKRAAASLEACVAIAAEPLLAEAEFELAGLRLLDLPKGPERLALLDALLAKRGKEKGAALFYYQRGLVYQEGRWSDPVAARAQALADFERVRELDGRGPWALKASLGAAQLAFDAEDYERASRHFQAIVDAAPTLHEGGEARLGLGQVAEKRQRFREALGHFELYLEMAPTSPRRPRCLIHIGDAHYFLGEWDLARDAYRRVAEEHADSPLVDDAVYRWALTEEKAGDEAAERERLRWLLASGGERFRREAAWRLAKQAEEVGDEEVAIGALRTLVSLGAGGAHAVEGALLLGRLLLDREEGEAALANYDALLANASLDDARPEAEAGGIRALLLVGRVADAQARWATLSAGTPLPDSDHAELLLAFGRAKIANDPGAAAGFLADCVARFPGSVAAPWALYELGLIDARGRDFDSAILRFDGIGERFPDHPAALRAAIRSAGILYNQGRFAEASARYESAMAMGEAPPPDLLYNSSLALEKIERYDEALRRVQSLLARYPEDEHVPDAMMKVGYLLQLMGQFERAILAYKNADIFQDREGKARLHFWIADCAEAGGDSESALAEFLKVGYMFGDQGLWGVTATLRAAGLCERGGNLRQARQLYERVLRGQGADSDFGRAASEALARIGAGGPQG